MDKRRPLCSLREAKKRYNFENVPRPRFTAESFCEWCGKLLTERSQHYCSAKCKRLYEKVTVWDTRGGYAQHILRRDSFSCQDCGELHALMNRHGLYVPATDGELDIHHILPVHLGGTDAPDNLVTLCKDCHVQRHRLMK